MNTKLSLVSFLTLTIVDVFSYPASAQEQWQADVLRLEGQANVVFQGQGGFAVVGQVGQQMPANAEQHRTSLQRYLAVRIDDLKRVCQLSDKQAKTLEVAAKGAVEQAAKKWQDQMKRLGVQFGGEQLRADAVFLDAGVIAEVPPMPVPVVPPPVEPFAEPADAAVRHALAEEVVFDEAAKQEQSLLEILDEALAPPKPVQPPPPAIAVNPPVAWAGPVVMPAGIAGNVASVAEEPVWTKTVDRVLTEAQKEAYRTATAERRAFKLRSAVNNVVAMIDKELLLSDSQRQQLAEVIAKSLGDQIFGVLPSGLGNNQMMFIARRIPSQKVKDVLSESQLARWGEFRQGWAPAQKPVQFFNNAGGGVIEIEEEVIGF